MATPFELHASKGNEVLHQITEQLKVSRDKAFQIVRAVLHTTRSHITIGESLQIIAQLPMALKGLYADQWDYKKEPVLLGNLDQFLAETSCYDKELTQYDLATRERTCKAVRAVYIGLEAYLPYYKFQEIMSAVPEVVREFIQNNINEPILEKA